MLVMGCLRYTLIKGLSISTVVGAYYGGSLEEPPAKATSDFTATLTWNGDGDVDLHILLWIMWDSLVGDSGCQIFVASVRSVRSGSFSFSDRQIDQSDQINRIDRSSN